ncbi:MAG: N-methyl-L-tryptophan oxidase [Thermoleophilia bacterium]|nr:N-methyl-L-tryptophan oxidase [Thermoleophilia bacterium]
MSADRYDAIVAGVGGMGSAAVYHLARRGKRVLGLERFEVPNELGSSHGLTRIIRLAYYEHVAYVPLLRRAYELWGSLEAEAGERLLHVTGSIDAGPPDRLVFAGSLRSCEQHGLPHEVLEPGEVARRFPAYRLHPSHRAVLQPDGGFLLPERCIAAHARLSGAEVRTGERVLGWEPDREGVRVRTEHGAYEAERLVLTAGAWMGDLAGLPVVAERQVLAWLAPSRPELFAPERFPVFNLQVAEDDRYYGFPTFEVPGFKLGRYHHLREEGPPDELDREPRPEDERVLREFAARYFPDGAGPAVTLKTCLFENSPDEHFLLDLHPDAPQVVVAGGFSGHGFKFCSVVGEILADLAVDGDTRHEIGFLRLGRFDGA